MKKKEAILQNLDGTNGRIWLVARKKTPRVVNFEMHCPGRGGARRRASATYHRPLAWKQGLGWNSLASCATFVLSSLLTEKKKKRLISRRGPDRAVGDAGAAVQSRRNPRGRAGARTRGVPRGCPFLSISCFCPCSSFAEAQKAGVVQCGREG